MYLHYSEGPVSKGRLGDPLHHPRGKEWTRIGALLVIGCISLLGCHKEKPPEPKEQTKLVKLMTLTPSGLPFGKGVSGTGRSQPHRGVVIPRVGAAHRETGTAGQPGGKRQASGQNRSSRFRNAGQGHHEPIGAG